MPHISKRRHANKYALYLKIVLFAASVLGLLVVVGIKYTSPKTSNSTVLSQTISMPTQIDPNFISQVQICFMPIAKAYNYNLRITSAFRSASDQDLIYAQGRTTPGDIVTNARGGNSIHNFGLAVDIVDQQKGYDISWDQLAKIGNFCGLEHGDRGMVDLPHFQHLGGLSLAQLKSGKNPPPLKLPCQLLADRFATNQPLTVTDLQNCRLPKL